jgi:putative transposase
MKKSRFSEEQIVGVLKEAEAGVPVKDLCRRLRVSDATFYHWKAKYGGLEVNEALRLRQLEEENGRLKKIVAQQALDIDALRVERSAFPLSRDFGHGCRFLILLRDRCHCGSSAISAPARECGKVSYRSETAGHYRTQLRRVHCWILNYAQSRYQSGCEDCSGESRQDQCRPERTRSPPETLGNAATPCARSNGSGSFCRGRKRHAKDWDYVHRAEALRTRPVLLVEADDQNHADREALGRLCGRSVLLRSNKRP